MQKGKLKCQDFISTFLKRDLLQWKEMLAHNNG
jgi:hypothetical protein